MIDCGSTVALGGNEDHINIRGLDGYIVGPFRAIELGKSESSDFSDSDKIEGGSVAVGWRSCVKGWQVLWSGEWWALSSGGT